MPIEDETFMGKLLRKSKADPFVPIGAMATVAMLTGGLYSFKMGQAALSQNFMRARVLAQAATVTVVGVGTFWLGSQAPSSEMNAAKLKALNNAAEAATKKKEEAAAAMAATLISPSSKPVSLNTDSMLAAVAAKRAENASQTTDN